jgi:hypothetical protein
MRMGWSKFTTNPSPLTISNHCAAIKTGQIGVLGFYLPKSNEMSEKGGIIFEISDFACCVDI